MNWRIAFRILLAVAVIAGVVAVGALSYRAGVMQGLAQSGKIEFVAPPPAEGGVAPWGYYGWPGFYRPWGFGPFGGFGFGLLGCLFPLLMLFLIFGLFRWVFWRPRFWGGGHHGPSGEGHHGPWGKGGPPMWREGARETFDEWHRQAHGEAPKSTEGGTQSA